MTFFRKTFPLFFANIFAAEKCGEGNEYNGELMHSGAAIGDAIEQRFPPPGAADLVKLSGW